ncbi:MAG TPA: L,D-transpeptidase [Verrucomicrobiae bacterium]|nr:L,D-transpeptidase [Verrucomicrobiae bacterium]
MNKNVFLDVVLPRNRSYAGWIRVELNGVPAAEFRVLGRGSTHVPGHPANPTLSPLMYGGNTPRGDYRGTEIDSTSDLPQNSYGPWGEIRLKAVSGEAVLAERLGRDGLLIHGGAEGAFDGFRPTHGCLRLHNADMKTLIGLISNAGDDATAQMCDAVSVRITVRDW